MAKEEKSLEPEEQKPTGDALTEEHEDSREEAKPDENTGLSEPQPDTEKSEEKPDVMTVAPAAAATPKRKFNFKEFIKTKKGKVTVAVAAVVLVIGLVFAIPASRYAVAGLVIKKDFTVHAVDSESGKPISSAQVSVANQSAKTDANGKAMFKNVPVGEYNVSAQKNYYQDGKVNATVPILSNPNTAQVKMVATGRQVPVTVVNKVSGVAVAGVEITAGDSAATTTDDGKAVLVLPADKAAVNATFKANSYNNTTADVTVTEQEDDKNTFAITPSGKVYFLSKRTGKLNVMSSDLDGSNANVVLAGTGKENDRTTVLLASRDWKYLALLANRDSEEQKLYLINTSDNKLTLMDEGAGVGFSPAGWYNEQFIYTVNRTNVKEWEPKRQSIKSFNASSAKIATLDDAAAGGTNSSDWRREVIGTVYILENQIVYSKHWSKVYSPFVSLSVPKDGIYSVKPNGENRQTLKEFDALGTGSIDARLYRPQEIYFKILIGSKTTFYEYEDSKIAETKAIDDNSFYSDTYPTYLVSPSGKATLWSEDRDGKQVVFKGDANGANGKEVIATDEYTPYGWYSDDYLLLSKGGSQLYIVAANGTGAQPLKVTDYHRPTYRFPGYGYGYGGL